VPVQKRIYMGAPQSVYNSVFPFKKLNSSLLSDVIKQKLTTAILGSDDLNDPWFLIYFWRINSKIKTMSFLLAISTVNATSANIFREAKYEEPREKHLGDYYLPSIGIFHGFKLGLH